MNQFSVSQLCKSHQCLYSRPIKAICRSLGAQRGLPRAATLHKFDSKFGAEHKGAVSIG
jgi:hypothetical protein